MNPYRASKKYNPGDVWYDSFAVGGGTGWIVFFGDEYIARVENEAQCENILQLVRQMRGEEKRPPGATHRGPAGYYKRSGRGFWLRHSAFGWSRSDVDERFLREILPASRSSIDKYAAHRDEAAQGRPEQIPRAVESAGESSDADRGDAE